MESLFPSHVDDAVETIDAPAPKPVGPFAAVALDQGIDRVLDYSIPAKLIDRVRVGQRVRVPLGRNNKSALGYVVSIHDTTDYPKIKKLTDIDDERVLVDGARLERGVELVEAQRADTSTWHLDLKQLEVVPARPDIDRHAGLRIACRRQPSVRSREAASSYVAGIVAVKRGRLAAIVRISRNESGDIRSE